MSSPGSSTPLKVFSVSVLGVTLFLLCSGFHLFSKLEACLFVGLGEGELPGMMSQMDRVEMTINDCKLHKENDRHRIIWMPRGLTQRERLRPWPTLGETLHLAWVTYTCPLALQSCLSYCAVPVLSFGAFLGTSPSAV